MKKEEINWERINRVLKDHVDLLCKSKMHPNCFRPRDNGSLEHEIECAVKCVELYRDGWVFFSQVKLKSGDIADILAVDNFGSEEPKIIEIACTETEDSIRKKIEKYPLMVEVVRI